MSRGALLALALGLAPQALAGEWFDEVQLELERGRTHATLRGTPSEEARARFEDAITATTEGASSADLEALHEVALTWKRGFRAVGDHCGEAIAGVEAAALALAIGRGDAVSLAGLSQSSTKRLADCDHAALRWGRARTVAGYAHLRAGRYVSASESFRAAVEDFESESEDAEVWFITYFDYEPPHPDTIPGDLVRDQSVEIRRMPIGYGGLYRSTGEASLATGEMGGLWMMFNYSDLPDKIEGESARTQSYFNIDRRRPNVSLWPAPYAAQYVRRDRGTWGLGSERFRRWSLRRAEALAGFGEVELVLSERGEGSDPGHSEDEVALLSQAAALAREHEASATAAALDGARLSIEGAYAEAAEMLTRAAEGGRGLDAARSWLRAGRAWVIVGDLDAAEVALQRVLSEGGIYELTEALTLADGLAQRGRVGALSEALSTVEEAIEEAEPTVVAPVHLEIATLHLRRGDSARALAALGRIEAPGAAVARRAATLRAQVLLRQGDPALAAAALEEAIEFLEGGEVAQDLPIGHNGLDPWLSKVTLKRLLWTAYRRAGDEESALQALDDALMLAWSTGDNLEIAACMIEIGNLLVEAGDLERAERAFEIAIGAAESHQATMRAAGIDLLSGVARALQGDLDAARVSLSDSAAALEGVTLDADLQVVASMVSMSAALVDGDTTEALSALGGALMRTSMSPARPTSLGEAYLPGVSALAVGEYAAAAVAFERLAAALDGSDQPEARGHTKRLRRLAERATEEASAAVPQGTWSVDAKSGALPDFWREVPAPSSQADFLSGCETPAHLLKPGEPSLDEGCVHSQTMSRVWIGGIQGGTGKPFSPLEAALRCYFDEDEACLKKTLQRLAMESNHNPPFTPVSPLLRGGMALQRVELEAAMPLLTEGFALLPRWRSNRYRVDDFPKTKLPSEALRARVDHYLRPYPGFAPNSAQALLAVLAGDPDSARDHFEEAARVWASLLPTGRAPSKLIKNEWSANQDLLRGLIKLSDGDIDGGIARLEEIKYEAFIRDPALAAEAAVGLATVRAMLGRRSEFGAVIDAADALGGGARAASIQLDARLSWIEAAPPDALTPPAVAALLLPLPELLNASLLGVGVGADEIAAVAERRAAILDAALVLHQADRDDAAFQTLLAARARGFRLGLTLRDAEGPAVEAARADLLTLDAPLDDAREALLSRPGDLDAAPFQAEQDALLRLASAQRAGLAPGAGLLETPSLTDVQDALLRMGDDPILLAYHLDNERVVVQRITADSYALSILSASAAEVERSAQKIREDMTAGASLPPSAHQRALQRLRWDELWRLYAALIAPLDPAPGRPLLIAPEGDLYGLPWAALLTAPPASPSLTNAQAAVAPYLGAARVIAVLPTPAWPALAPPRAASIERALLIGVVALDEEAPLPGVQAELDAALRGLDGTSVTLACQRSGERPRLPCDARPTLDLWSRESPHADWIHVASHGGGTSDPALQARGAGALSWLSLERDDARGERARLWEHRIAHGSLQAELIVLSACTTATAQVDDMEGALGVARAALGAGARSAIASQWGVDDDATAALMTALYGAPQSGAWWKAEALRGAQAAVRARDGGAYAHPYYWAGFSLIGSPG